VSSRSSIRGPYRKPRADIYTVLLALALVAIIIGCVVLFQEVADYGEQPYQLSLSAPVEQDHGAGTYRAGGASRASPVPGVRPSV
jgi:hypothetical protein